MLKKRTCDIYMNMNPYILSSHSQYGLWKINGECTKKMYNSPSIKCQKPRQPAYRFQQKKMFCWLPRSSTFFTGGSVQEDCKSYVTDWFEPRLAKTVSHVCSLIRVSLKTWRLGFYVFLILQSCACSLTCYNPSLLRYEFVCKSEKRVHQQRHVT
jgi:hypothetical protein